MRQHNQIIFEFLSVYMRLSFLFYEAVALGLKEKEPELFEEQSEVLNDMKKLIMEELGSLQKGG
jgi:hypothetical protein